MFFITIACRYFPGYLRRLIACVRFFPVRRFLTVFFFFYWLIIRAVGRSATRTKYDDKLTCSVQCSWMASGVLVSVYRAMFWTTYLIWKHVLMVVTHSQETCTRNLCKSTCTRNLTVWHGFLYKIFIVQVSCTEYSTALFHTRNLHARVHYPRLYPDVSLSLHTFQFFVC